eukprot:Rhum_TRINITY_DN17145_c0_g1::Rhum_TRINITY_DN17145_c0_g1_i1::g.165389::m.165389
MEKMLDFVYRWSASPEDTPHDVHSKKTMSVLFLCVFMTFPLLLAYERDARGFYFYLCASFIVIPLFLFVWMICYKRVDTTFIFATMLSSAIIVTLQDLYTGSMFVRTWPLFLVQIDILFMLKAPHWMVSVFLTYVVVYLAVTATEQITRFGLYDLPLLPTYDSRKSLVLCDEPPCPGHASLHLVAFASGMLVVFCNFIIIRSISGQFAEEKRRVDACVSATHGIAASLARFDLARADELLSASDTKDLPDDLRLALQRLLANLHSYRPFLSETLFESAGVRTAEKVALTSPPGIESKKACIVFTDVTDAAVLWCTDPKGMADAMLTHNSVLREIASATGGYEVKVIGDSFMFAFESLAAGADFCFAAHTALHTAEWPWTLLGLRGDIDKKDCWHGLTVNMGMAAGSVQMDLDPSTRRVDYSGSAVNTAARLLAVSLDGSLTMLSSDTRGLPLSGAMIRDLGTVELKGLCKAYNLAALYPAHLKQRAVERNSVPVRASHQLPITALTSMAGSFTVSKSVRVDLKKILDSTVASVEIACPDEWSITSESAWQNHMGFLLSCAERCQGHTISVVGRAATVCWNMTKPCPRHVENCFKFAGLLSGAAFSYAVGCSSGPVTAGTLGREGQRFVNVAGECVSLSRRLGEVARLMKIECLYANLLEKNYVSLPIWSLLTKLVEWPRIESTCLKDYTVYSVHQLDNGSTLSLVFTPDSTDTPT